MLFLTFLSINISASCKMQHLIFQEGFNEVQRELLFDLFTILYGTKCIVFSLVTGLKLKVTNRTDLVSEKNIFYIIQGDISVQINHIFVVFRMCKVLTLLCPYILRRQISKNWPTISTCARENITIMSRNIYMDKSITKYSSNLVGMCLLMYHTEGTKIIFDLLCF